jgi:hypothetical protein
MTKTMSSFTSAPSRSLLRWDGTIPTGLFLGLLVLAGVIHLSVGMLTYLATRSRDGFSYLAGAAAVGLVGSVVGFTLYVGPLALFTTAILPTRGDLVLLGQGFTTREPRPVPEGESPPPHPQDRLLARYPELATVPEKDRAGLLYAKVLSDNILGMYEGLLLGMVLTLAYALPVSIGGTLLAGRLVRRWGSPRAAIFPYLEVSMAVSVGWFQVLVLILAAGGTTQTSGMGPEGWGFTLFLLVVPPYVVLRDWRGPDRWRFYSLGLGATLLLLIWSNDEFGLKWIGLGVFVGGVLLTARQWLRGQSVHSAPITPVAAPSSNDATRTHPDSSNA